MDDRRAALPRADERRANAQRLVARLGPGERKALKWIVDGHSLIQIANKLGITLEETILLKGALFRKLGGRFTADLVRIGLEAGLDSGA